MSPSYSYWHPLDSIRFQTSQDKAGKPKAIRDNIFQLRALWNYLVTWKTLLICVTTGEPPYPSPKKHTTLLLSLSHPLLPFLQYYWWICTDLYTFSPSPSSLSPKVHLFMIIAYMSFPGGASCKEPTSQCWRHKRCRFDPWVGKIPWNRKWQTVSVFLPGKVHGQETKFRGGVWQATVCGATKSWKWLSYWTHTYMHIPCFQRHLGNNKIKEYHPTQHVYLPLVYFSGTEPIWFILQIFLLNKRRLHISLISYSPQSWCQSRKLKREHFCCEKSK